jgi:hypothetical protein
MPPTGRDHPNEPPVRHQPQDRNDNNPLASALSSQVSDPGRPRRTPWGGQIDDVRASMTLEPIYLRVRESASSRADAVFLQLSSMGWSKS